MKSNKAKEKSIISMRGKGGKCKTTLSPHKKLYVMNKKRKETNKHKTILFRLIIFVQTLVFNKNHSLGSRLFERILG